MIYTGRHYFTDKADDEIARDGLTEEDVLEAILDAPIISKTIRSNRREPDGSPEYLYVIPGMTYLGITVHTKGKILKRKTGEEYFYVIISSKRYIG